MSNRAKAAGAGAPASRRRLGDIAAALAALLMTWTVASGDARAERIVLRSGEVVEGSIIEATRNTVIIQRSIGGMRQMRIQEIEEVRFDLAQGQQIAGQFLGWADGVYEVRSGNEIVRVSESGILSREPGQQTARLLATRPRGERQSTAAAAPSAATTEQRAGPTAAPASESQNRSRAAADAGSDAATADAERAAAGGAERQASDTGALAAAVPESQAGDTDAQAVTDPESQSSDTEAQAAAHPESQSSDTEAQAAADARSQAAADAQTQAAADPQSQAAAGEEHAAVGDQGALAVKASVDPPEPGARSLVFNIELSQPAKQTVVLIYGTVDGTAKAGEDYEAQQGMVTLAPGARTAEVRVPLIEGQPDDGEKRFELVLMADPKVADIVDRRVIATIKGAD